MTGKQEMIVKITGYVCLAAVFVVPAIVKWKPVEVKVD